MSDYVYVVNGSLPEDETIEVSTNANQAAEAAVIYLGFPYGARRAIYKEDIIKQLQKGIKNAMFQNNSKIVFIDRVEAQVISN